MPDPLLDEAARIRTRSGRTAEVVGLLADRIAELEQDNEGLSRHYDAALRVVRRLTDGWRPGKNMAVVIAGSPRPDPVPIWMHRELRHDSEPMTDADRRVLDASSGLVDVQPPSIDEQIETVKAWGWTHRASYHDANPERDGKGVLRCWHLDAYDCSQRERGRSLPLFLPPYDDGEDDA